MLYWLHHEVNRYPGDIAVPRKYDLGKRAVQQADTRRRIVDSALELYQEKGIGSTTMLDVARRADVAPGTVANHFGSAEALATEVMTQILADLRMPTPDLFDGVDAMSDRIRLLIGELSAFFERGTQWWQVSQREPAGVHAWADVEARYYAELDALVRSALGPRAKDSDAVAMILVILHRWVIGSLQATGRSAEEAERLVSDLLISWLATRHPAADGGHLSSSRA